MRCKNNRRLGNFRVDKAIARGYGSYARPVEKRRESQSLSAKKPLLCLQSDALDHAKSNYPLKTS
jgi:hypothetical protein